MLTDLKIHNAKPRDRLYRVADARGLCLEAHPNGARYWRFRYHWAGKGKMLSLGVYPETSLAEARQQHEVVRAL